MLFTLPRVWIKQLLLVFLFVRQSPQNPTEKTLVAALLQSLLDCLFCGILTKFPKKCHLYFCLSFCCVVFLFYIKFHNPVAFSCSVLLSQFQTNSGASLTSIYGRKH